jgi:hypothetical protein
MRKIDKGRDKLQDKGRSKCTAKQGVPAARGVSGVSGSWAKPDASVIFKALRAIQSDMVLLCARKK